MKYYGRNNKSYELGKLLGAGGEGSVYVIDGIPDSVAKIYKAERLKDSNERNRMEKKIEAMLAAPVSPYANGNLVVAWPTDILYDGSGNFQGFVMPSLQGKKSIYWVYREWERQQLFNNRYRWDMSVAVAYNLAAAVQTVHNAGIVIGDFNSNNIQIDKNGIVTLIDADSFNVTAKDGQLFKCGVGVQEMLPPELQGLNLSKPESQFTFATDRFSLAIHIFMLLCNNCHPFTCHNATAASSSSSHSAAVRNIVQGYCPYVTGVGNVPASAPDMAFLPLDIRNLFDRAFKYDATTAVKATVISNRPTADEWIAALDKLHKSELVECSKNPLHHYPAHYHTGCPWCAVENKKNTLMVPIVNSPNATNVGQRYNPGNSPKATVTSVTLPTPPAPATKGSTYRHPWVLFAVCLIVGAFGSAFPAAYFAKVLSGLCGVTLGAPFIRVVLFILGLIGGGLIAAMAFESYEYDDKGWLWLFGSALGPIAAWICIFVLAVAITLVVGLLSAALYIIGIIFVVAFFCNG